MENTSNYGLKRWDPEDRILHTEFNDNWDKIDTALKANADGVAALQTALGSGGKTCRISSGSYAGNGKTGQSNPSSLTFDFTPVLVVIIRKSSPGTHTLFVRPNGYGPMGDTMGTITWGEKKVSWYCQNPQVAGDVQMNMSGSDYYYVGLGY